MLRTGIWTIGCAALAMTISLPGAGTEPEVTGVWQGRIETLVVDNFQTGTSRQRFFLHTSLETLELEGGTGWQAGQMVEVTGRAAGKHLVVMEAKAPPHTDSIPNTCSATGQQNVAVILASFPSKKLLSWVTPKFMRSSFFGAGRTVNGFLLESSFGQTWAAGDVLGPFVLDADYFDQPLAARDAALRAAAPSANLTKYNRIFVVAPQGEMGMDSGGMALLGCGPISSPQGTLNASSMWLGAESMVTQADVVATASHELGHGFGLEHARFADYGSDALGPAGETAAPWDQLHEYGDSFSSMGRNSGQWAAPQKALLGWLQVGANIQTVTTHGNLVLAPYERSGSGQVIKVSRGAGANDWLWVEFRQPLGTFDATLPTTAFAGALVHYQDPALTATIAGVDPGTYTNLVNFHPATFANDPTLHAGETWKDPYGTVTLAVSSVSSAGLSLSVSYAPAPVCASSLGSAQSFGADGGTGEIAVTAPGACSWSAVSSASWITLGSAPSGTGSGGFSFTVAANVNMAPRWGKITAGDSFVIVTQAGAPSGWMTISPQAATIPASGGTGEIAVATSAPDLAWAFGTNVSWITDVECSCYLDVGPATLRYVVAVNTGAQRSGVINVDGQVFTVTQQAGTSNLATVNFSQLAPANAPISRLDTAMARFGSSGQAILYGGNWNTTRFSDTWLWDGSNWNLLNPANNPGILAGHAMAYDAARGQIVLFGGMAGVTAEYSNQTWIWNGTNWVQMHPAVSPPARYGHAMAYDAATKQVVLFGGYGDFAESNDTWTWNGSNWSHVASSVNPPPRSGHSMAFDALHGEIVLFGGFLSQPTPTWYSDTWVWNGKKWQQKLTATPPAGRAGHVMAYHTALQSVVMIGGAGGKDVTDSTWNYDFRRETWMWNGSTWTQEFPEIQPGPAYTLGAAYDDTKQALIIQLGDDLTCLSRGPKTFLLK
jgi:Galactose oxidase, central domain